MRYALAVASGVVIGALLLRSPVPESRRFPVQENRPVQEIRLTPAQQADLDRHIRVRNLQRDLDEINRRVGAGEVTREEAQAEYARINAAVDKLAEGL